MRIGVIPETSTERIGLWAGLVPVPILETYNAMILARSLMASVKLGVYDALAAGPLSTEALANQAGIAPEPAERLFYLLAEQDYLAPNDDGTWALTPISRRWLLTDSPDSISDFLIVRYTEWDWIGHLEDYLRTGVPYIGRADLGDEGWLVYQRAMRSLARMSTQEIARRMPTPTRPTTMLDIGGGHGQLSVAFCRRYANLRAVVLDLPDACRQAAPLLAEEEMGDRVVLRPGDALADDLGRDTWDIVTAMNIVHTLSPEQTRHLIHQVGPALKPGGIFAVIDFMRPTHPRGVGQTPALMNLFFGLVNRSGAWTSDELANWQREAGLQPLKPMRIKRLPGSWIQAARRPE